MKKPVLEALQALLLHKSFTTYAEVASVAGVKKLLAVKVLNANAALLIMDKKTGKITGLVDKVKEAQNRAYENGLTYILGKDDYMGHYIDTRNKKALAELGVDKWIMDSQVRFIPNENGNLPKVEAMGLVAIRAYKVPAFSTYWDE